MTRTVRTMRSNRAFIPIITFRWLLWVLALGMLSVGARAGSNLPPALIGLLVASTAAYNLLWTLRCAALTRLASRQPALLAADLLLSALPAWLSGGWSSPFLPFMFGALMLPGALFDWRGVLVAIVGYIIVDQIVGRTAWRAGTAVPPAWPWGLLRYTLPVAAALIGPLSIAVWKRRTQRPSPSTASRMLPARMPMHAPGRVVQPAPPSGGATGREAGSSPAASWSLVRPRSQTLERLPLQELHAAIRQIVSEAEDHGLTVRLALHGAQPVLPPGHIQLLAKVVEVGLDNVRCHAHTREAEVTVATDETNVLLIVRDHGTGLLDGTAEPPGFHQIKRLRYRIEEVEGTLNVREHEAGGVVVTARVPRDQ